MNHNHPRVRRFLQCLVLIYLVTLSLSASGWQMSTAAAGGPEGTIIEISYTVETSDWLVPNEQWIQQCISTGSVDPKWVFPFRFRPVNGSATFEETTPPTADLHLLAGDTVQVSEGWYYCSDEATPPVLSSTGFFKFSLLNDELVEDSESAFVYVYLNDEAFSEVYEGALSTVIDDATPPNENSCSSVSIACDRQVRYGTLRATDCDDSPRGAGHLADLWTFEGIEGEPVLIHADWNVDGYLYLESPSGNIVFDDDHTSILDSQIDTYLTESGTHKIWTTSYYSGDLADYGVSLTCADRAFAEMIFKSSFEIRVTNMPPVADASTDQRIYGGGTFPATLVGERSTDPDGRIVSSSWTQISGPTVVLTDTSGLNRDFLAPGVATETELVFELTVQDDDGAVDTDTVSVTVLPAVVNITLENTGSSQNSSLQLVLFDPDGNELWKDTGFAPQTEYELGAGVIYAVATASPNLAFDQAMLLSVTGPDGLSLSSEVSLTRLSDLSLPFLTFDDLRIDPVRFLVYGQNEDFNTYPAHPQVIEIALSHPDSGLRDSNRFLKFLNQSAIRYQEDLASAEAYYRAVDPDNLRTTLSDWLQVTGFADGGHDAHALYQNDADLGFGRDMYARENADGSVASYVRNFPSLEHAINKEQLIATVAMEFSPEAGHPDPYTKFFVFGPNGERLPLVDLDGRGAKPVPGVCNVCHGGAPKKIERDESGAAIFPDQGDTDGQFLPWDVDTLLFADEDNFRRADQEEQLYLLNQVAKATYPSSPGSVTGYNWTGAAATELVDGWYAGGQTFDGSFVPPGWSGSPEQEQLYLKVVGPNCRACHITRGTALQNAIDFSTYDKFVDYAPLIRELVYNQGVMPLALRTFGHFWTDLPVSPENPEGLSPAALLADLLPGFSDLTLPDGTLLKPGRPIARTGMMTAEAPDLVEVQVIGSHGVVLDGRDSLFARDQDWRVVSSTYTTEDTTDHGSLAVSQLAPGDDAAPFSMVRQIVPPATVKRTRIFRNFAGAVDWASIDDSLSDQLQVNCGGCHSAGGPYPNIPIYFDGLLAYWNVLDLINFEQPTQSLLLTKPGGFRHGGGAVFEYDYFAVSGGEILPMFDRGPRMQTLSRWVQGQPKWNSGGINNTCRYVDLDIPDDDSDGLTSKMYLGPAWVTDRLSIIFQLDHENFSDLEVTLTNLETGESSVLIDHPPGAGGSDCAFDGITLSFDPGDTTADDSADLCSLTPSEFDALVLRPDTPFTVFEGSLSSGTWQFEVKDLSPGATGQMRNWCFHSGSY